MYLFLHDLHVGLALSLFVLEGAIEQDDARVLDVAPHLGVGDILVDHNSAQHTRLFDGSSGNLLNFGIAGIEKQY